MRVCIGVPKVGVGVDVACCTAALLPARQAGLANRQGPGPLCSLVVVGRVRSYPGMDWDGSWDGMNLHGGSDQCLPLPCIPRNAKS